MTTPADRKTAVLLRGTSVSPGLARGPLVLLDEGLRTPSRAPGTAAQEEASLATAIDAATDELAALMGETRDTDAEAILAFQAEMLGDDVVTAPAFGAIAAGAPAEAAWRDAMEAQIRDYHEAEDLYFRARASDLRDMRDRVLRRLAGTAPTAIASGSIVVANDLPPSRFLEIAWDGGGAVLFEGSPNSHVAMLARARGVPMIIGLERGDLRGHKEALLDSTAGVLIASPNAEDIAELTERRRVAEVAQAEEMRYLTTAAVTASGTGVQVMINVADGTELDGIDVAHCDGIGLVRTELLLRTMDDLRDEEKQYRAYRRIMLWANGKPVTIRTMDAGGDKPIPGYTVDGEGNPFLGIRGVRLSLQHPEVLTIQLRALARAAALGPLKVMVPMITTPRELDHVRVLLDLAVNALRSSNVQCAMPELGMMVEVPAAALAIDLFDANFLSIGSNDLIQYVTASSRDSSRLAPLQDPLQPAVLRLIRTVVENADSRQIPISLCGDMASDERCISALLGVGLRSLSVAPAALGRVKRAIACHRACRPDGGRSA
jgi:phosphotransferase system enzyme I (PtsI)